VHVEAERTRWLFARTDALERSGGGSWRGGGLYLAWGQRSAGWSCRVGHRPEGLAPAAQDAAGAAGLELVLLVRPRAAGWDPATGAHLARRLAVRLRESLGARRVHLDTAGAPGEPPTEPPTELAKELVEVLAEVHRALLLFGAAPFGEPPAP
ncbi:hypothetical protein, partial [Kineococcus indalonis]|uniref:hypothetical protein n=1 Tax=Kineococcus indalonis TaxID=2696566 RepID=UPI0014121C5C